MTAKITILRVALASPLYRCFDYLPPAGVAIDQLCVGARVRVPFGRQEKIGILTDILDHTDIAPSKLKAVLAVLDHEDILTEPVRRLCTWVSGYYHHPLGDVLVNALPALLRKKEAVLDVIPAIPAHDLQQAPLPANKDQQLAIETINAHADFHCYLLDGVTGSGKTEVYLQAITPVLARGQQVLVLVPEIGLTPQTVARFQQRFAVPIAIIHSRLSDKKRFQAWSACKTGEAKILIGTRSAVWTPLPQLGLIILDEEHDLSFKQQSGCRYSARDLAVIRAKKANVPIVLGSATPSLESLYNVSCKKFMHLTLPERAGTAIKPHYKVIDIRNQHLDGGFSPQLLLAMREHLNRDGQVLIFLNRRGFAPILMCHSCAWIARCPHCDVNLTLHADPPKLFCHHCGTSRPRYHRCLSCQSSQVISLGLGTEQLEIKLTTLFPENDIIRIDRDTTKRQHALDDMLEKIHQGGGQILVGTQMLAKGHHFPNVTLVAIIDADSGLFSSDFRASERFGQLTTQVSGRSGRAEKPGTVILQTYQPDHPLLKVLLKEGYAAFAQHILLERQQAQLPPYEYFALLRADATSSGYAYTFLEQVIAGAPKTKEVQMLGPIPALMHKKGGRFYLQIMLQASQRKTLQLYLRRLIPIMEQLPSQRKVRWAIDVDPQEMG